MAKNKYQKFIINVDVVVIVNIDFASHNVYFATLDIFNKDD